MKMSHQEWSKKLSVEMYSEYNIYELTWYFYITYISIFVTILW